MWGMILLVKHGETHLLGAEKFLDPRDLGHQALVDMVVEVILLQVKVLRGSYPPVIQGLWTNDGLPMVIKGQW